MHDALSAWNQQVNLGFVLKEIRDEFAQRPPTKRGEDTYSSRPPPPLPTQPAETMNLNRSSAEVEELLTNDFAFEMFFNSLERVQNLKTVQEELRNGNENLAHKNLGREDQLLKLRAEVGDMDKEYKALKAEFEGKERQQQEAFSRFTASTVLTRLKASVYESDELSESVAQSFLD
ncbi:hypothetical protein DFQ29_009573, partial [Apophysomyces sp. BC1021]